MVQTDSIRAMITNLCKQPIWQPSNLNYTSSAQRLRQVNLLGTKFSVDAIQYIEKDLYLSVFCHLFLPHSVSYIDLERSPTNSPRQHTLSPNLFTYPLCFLTAYLVKSRPSVLSRASDSKKPNSIHSADKAIKRGQTLFQVRHVLYNNHQLFIEIQRDNTLGLVILSKVLYRCGFAVSIHCVSFLDLLATINLY